MSERPASRERWRIIQDMLEYTGSGCCRQTGRSMASSVPDVADDGISKMVDAGRGAPKLVNCINGHVVRERRRGVRKEREGSKVDGWCSWSNVH